MCILSFILGWTFGYEAAMPKLQTIEELEQSLIPYERCIKDGNKCKRELKFYIEYYNIKWLIEAKL